MPGFMVKDWFLYKKQMILFAFGTLLISAIALLKPPVEFTGMEAEPVIILIDSLVILMVFFVIGMFEQWIYELDEMNKWKLFVISTPQREKIFVLTKYVITFCISLITLLWCNGVCMVVSEINDVKIDLFWLILFIASVQIILRSIEIPIILRFGSKYGSSYRMIVSFIGVFLVFCYLLFGDLSFFGSEEQILNRLVKLLSGDKLSLLKKYSIRTFGTAVISYIFSYYISVKLYKKSI